MSQRDDSRQDAWSDRRSCHQAAEVSTKGLYLALKVVDHSARMSSKFHVQELIKKHVFWGNKAILETKPFESL